MTEQKGASSLGSMLASRKPGEPTKYGRIFKPDEAWLAKAPKEEILDSFDLSQISQYYPGWERNLTPSG